MTVTVDASTTPTTTRRDLGAHIESVFSLYQVGTFLTVAQIVNTPTDEYPDSKPSAGAVTARLFPASGVCTVPGVRPDYHPETGARGATRVVEFVIDGVRWQTGPVG